MHTTEIPGNGNEIRTASLAAVISVAVGLVLLFAFTTFLDSAYRLARRDRAEARYAQGLALAAQGHNAEAVEDFRAALIYQHDNPQYRFALAQSLVGLKRWNEAENYLLELRASDPTNGPVNLMLARIAARAGRTDEAIQDYHRAIFGYWPQQPEQNRVAAQFGLIDLLDHLGRERQALAELLQLSGEVPSSDLTTHQKVAAMLLAHGSAQHAAEAYRAIHAAYPHDAEAERGLGDAEFALGDFSAAHRAYDAAARLGGRLPGLAERLALTNSILELDPTLLRLSANQRFARSRELLSRTLDAAANCPAVAPALLASAEAVLSQTRRPLRNGETAQMLTLAQTIWRARTAGCPRQPLADQPLAALMGKMLRQ